MSSDLEWYLDVGGKQSGPHSAKEIVEMVRSGKIPATSHVTAARMNGDWVAAQDLIDAYDELYTKPALAVPAAASAGPAFTATTTDPNFTAPPRPTEQLEKSKIITLNRDDLEKTPDPTEALFQAIQAVREKAVQKGAASASSARDTFGELSRPAGPRVPPQFLILLAIAIVLAGAVYAFMARTETADEPAKPPVARKAAPAPPPPPPAPAGGGLLNDRGGGTSAARTAPPVAPIPSRKQSSGRVIVPAQRESREERGGGARYRDDRDPPIEDSPDVDESDIEPSAPEMVEPMPVDPSQVPSDRVIPEPGTIPGRGPLPGADPYQPPAGDEGP